MVTATESQNSQDKQNITDDLNISQSKPAGNFFICSFAEYLQRQNDLIEKQFTSRKRKR